MRLRRSLKLIYRLLMSGLFLFALFRAHAWEKYVSGLKAYRKD